MSSKEASKPAPAEKKQSTVLYHALNFVLIAVVFLLAAWRYFVVGKLPPSRLSPRVCR